MRPEEPVSRIMTEAVVVIEADRPVSEALECFSHYAIHHLPVVRNGRLAGMLSPADVTTCGSAATGRVPADGSPARAAVTIEELMQSPVVSLGQHASLGEAGERLIESGVYAVPIVDELDHVLGIVTTSDIIRGFLHGPPRRGSVTPPRSPQRPVSSEPEEEPQYRLRPTDAEYATALKTAEVLHVEARDLRYLGKTLLYLDQRRAYLEKVLELADRFLLTGQGEHVHALLLKAIHAAKRAEEHASGTTGTPFPLE